MGHRCHHGHYIKDSWMECPECLAENDAYEAAEAAREAVEEAKKQTKILEKLASSTYSEPYSPTPQKNSLTESQNYALLAEERLKMDDIPGAIELINNSIKLSPNFISFYFQRAKYYSVHRNKDSMLKDLKYCVESNSDYFQEIFQKLSKEKWEHFEYYKKEISDFLLTIKKDTKMKAANSLNNLLIEIEGISSQLTNSSLGKEVDNIKKRYHELLNELELENFLVYLKIPADSKILIDKVNVLLSSKNKIENNVRKCIESYEKLLNFKGKYGDEFDSKLFELEKSLFNSIEKIKDGKLSSFEYAQNILKKAEEFYDALTKKKSNIDYEEYKQKREMEQEEKEYAERQKRRNRASAEYAKNGAWLFGIIGSMAGCVSCLEKGDYNFWGGAILGAMIGALLGAIIGQMKT